MNAKDAIKQVFELSSMVISKYIGDLTDADLMRRPGPECNHIAWQLGHLISSEAGLLNAIQPGAGPTLPEKFDEHHSPANKDSNDPTQFCTQAEYVSLLEKVRTASKALLESVPDSVLDEPSPESMRGFLPRKGDIFILIGTHGLMHAGQFVPVRRAAGKPIVI